MPKVKTSTAEQTEFNSVQPKKIKNNLSMPRSRKIFIALMLAYPILHFLVFWLYININTFVISFERFSYTSGKNVFVGFMNYEEFFRNLSLPSSATLRHAIVNSILYLPFNNFILLPLSVICAYFLFKGVFGHRVFRVVFFFPSIISIVVLTMSFSFMFNTQFGPIVKILQNIGLGALVPPNGFFGTPGLTQGMVFLYCLWAGIGYNVVLLTGAITRIPEEVLEAGKLDGIPMRKELFMVVVPLIFPTISTLFITGSMVVFTLFLQPMLLANGGPNGTTYTIAYYIVDMVNNNRLEEAAAAGIIFSIIGIPIVQLIKWGMEKITPQVDF